MTKTVLVTGANRGIGLEIARQLSQRGLTVLLGSRDAVRGQEAAKEIRKSGGEVVPLQLDVTDQTSVEAAAKFITQQHGSLDILINNAGVLVHQESGKLSLQAFKTTFATNVLGMVRVTEVMLPLLKRATGSRIINVSSELGSGRALTQPQHRFYTVVLPAYQSSKAAVNALTLQLAKALQGDGIVCNAVDPGVTATDMNFHTGNRTASEAAEHIVWLALLEDSPTGKIYADRKVVAF